MALHRTFGIALAASAILFTAACQSTGRSGTAGSSGSTRGVNFPEAALNPASGGGAPSIALGQIIGGMSMVGTLADGMQVCEYFGDDGVMVGYDGHDDGIYRLGWMAESDELCVIHESGEQTCGPVAMDGNDMTLFTTVGTVQSSGVLMPGNACE